MAFPIGSITPGAAAALSPLRPETAPAPGFKDMLESAIGRVENLRHTADAGIERILSGETEELHGAVMATQRAELAFEMFLQVRNKVTQAYQEIMRMHI